MKKYLFTLALIVFAMTLVGYVLNLVLSKNSSGYSKIKYSDKEIVKAIEEKKWKRIAIVDDMTVESPSIKAASKELYDLIADTNQVSLVFNREIKNAGELSGDSFWNELKRSEPTAIIWNGGPTLFGLIKKEAEKHGFQGEILHNFGK